MAEIANYTDKFDKIGIPWEIASFYINKFRDRYFVVKVSGDLIRRYTAEKEITVPEDLVLMQECGINIIVVNGGKEAINEALGNESEFIDGQRVTKPEDMEPIEKAMRNVNLKLRSQIEKAGGMASSLERSLWAKRYSDRHGLTGIPFYFSDFSISQMTQDSIVVASPVGCMRDNDYTLDANISIEDDYKVGANINADTAASFIASQMKAEKLMLLTDKNGVMIDDSLVSELSGADAQKYIADGRIDGGMLPKVRYAIKARESGVNSVHIINGYKGHALLKELFSSEGIGTMITNG